MRELKFIFDNEKAERLKKEGWKEFDWHIPVLIFFGLASLLAMF